MHHVDRLTGMPGPNVGHYIGRLLAAEFAVGTLEAGWLVALVLIMPGHVALDGEGTAASGTAIGLVVGVFRIVNVPHAVVRIIIRHRYGVLTRVFLIVLGLKALARLQRQVEIQQWDRRVETWNFKIARLNRTKLLAAGREITERI